MGLSYLIRQIADLDKLYIETGRSSTFLSSNPYAFDTVVEIIININLFYIENIQLLHFADTLQPHSPEYTTKVQVGRSAFSR